METRMTLSHLGCSSCVRKVTNALQTLPGIEVIHTDIPSKTVHIRYASDQTTLDAIKSTLAEARYPIVKEEPVDSISIERKG
jgi:copper chaperone